MADSGNERVSVFAGDGTFLRALTGPLDEPTDVAFGEGGRVFVADAGDDRIDVFSAAGGLVLFFGSGELTDPSGVAVEGPEVFVADSGGNSIDVFEDGGEFLRSFGSSSLSSPRDVIVGPGGNLYVADHGNGEIDVFTTAGEFIESIGEEGPGQLDGPVALASDADELFVADQVAERIERFDDDGDFLGGFAAKPNVAGVGVGCSGNVFAVEEGAQLARVERFGEPGTPPPPCAETSVPIYVPAAKPPSNRFHFAGLIKNRRNGSAVLYVRVPGSGRVILKGRGVRRLARGAPRAKRVRLPVKPKVRLRHFLKRHGKGRIRVEVTFKPIGGEPRTLEKVIVLKRKRG